MYNLLFICFGCSSTNKIPKYTVGATAWLNGKYSFINSRGDTIRKLEKYEYEISFTHTFEKFAVFSIKGLRGWSAIDINENVLFTVGNFPEMELWSPDWLVEDRIRIVDESGRIGFANSRGKIVVKPRFEMATQFKNGLAIVGVDCYDVLCISEWEEIDLEELADELHYGLECNKLGCINKRGRIIRLGGYTYDELQEMIGWESSKEKSH